MFHQHFVYLITDSRFHILCMLARFETRSISLIYSFFLITPLGPRCDTELLRTAFAEDTANIQTTQKPLSRCPKPAPLHTLIRGLHTSVSILFLISMEKISFILLPPAFRQFITSLRHPAYRTSTTQIPQKHHRSRPPTYLLQLQPKRIITYMFYADEGRSHSYPCVFLCHSITIFLPSRLFRPLRIRYVSRITVWSSRGRDWLDGRCMRSDERQRYVRQSGLYRL